jgi:hypothetical protein
MSSSPSITSSTSPQIFTRKEVSVVKAENGRHFVKMNTLPSEERMGAGLSAVKSGFILFIKNYQFPLQINTLERERDREGEIYVSPRQGKTRDDDDKAEGVYG